MTNGSRRSRFEVGFRCTRRSCTRRSRYIAAAPSEHEIAVCGSRDEGDPGRDDSVCERPLL